MEKQDWDLAFDPATGLRRRQEDVAGGRILPSSRWPNFFSRVVAKLQWDEQRHARFFDRVAAEVLKLPGETKEERGVAAREIAPPGIVDLFETQLPAMSAEMAEGRADLNDGMALYHMTLEGMVLSAGQRALLENLDVGALPGVRQGVYHVELDERWHIGFGLRCLIDRKPPADLIDGIMARAEESAEAWGDALPDHIREAIVPMARRRLAYVTRQIDQQAAAA